MTFLNRCDTLITKSHFRVRVTSRARGSVSIGFWGGGGASIELFGGGLARELYRPPLELKTCPPRMVRQKLSLDLNCQRLVTVLPSGPSGVV